MQTLKKRNWVTSSILVPLQAAKNSRAGPSNNFQDKLSCLHARLLPPPIPEVDNWGIPTESLEPWDPALYVSYTRSISNYTLSYSHFYSDVGQALSIESILYSEKRSQDRRVLCQDEFERVVFACIPYSQKKVSK